MENKNYDLKLAGYIWSILKTQPVLVMSWGVDMDTIKPVKGGLEFHSLPLLFIDSITGKCPRNVTADGFFQKNFHLYYKLIQLVIQGWYSGLY